MAENEKAAKKKSSWTFNGTIATIKAPSGKTREFDFSKLDNTAFAYYGKKQWLADVVASVQGEDEKIAGMVAVYNEAITAGIELTETGRIHIVGKERANAVPSEDKKAITALKEASTVVSLEGLILKKTLAAAKGKPEDFTAEDEAKLDELMAVAVAASKSIKKNK